MCGDDFGIFGKFVAIGEQESDIHVEGSRLIGALVADIYDGDGVFRDVGENVDCGRSVADVCSEAIGAAFGPIMSLLCVYDEREG